MLNSFKVIVRNYTRKDGGSFTKITCGGKFLPLATAEDDTTYTVAFTKASKVQAPTKEGIYEVAYAEKGLWLDSRDPNKNVCRVNAEKVVYNKALPTLEKDIRVK